MGREAVAYGPSCPQETIIPGTEEDCLFLNVFTPATPHQNLPIMVWIHGGSFVTGAGSGQGGLPAYFANSYDGCGVAAGFEVIVVVSELIHIYIYMRLSV